MKIKICSLWLLLGAFVVTLLSAHAVSSQNKIRIVQWPEIIFTPVNTPGSGFSQELAEIDALEIMDIAVDGKSITIGQSFAADDEWLKSLTVRVKNVSRLNISSVQMDLFLPEIMRRSLVTLCFGCGGVAKGRALARRRVSKAACFIVCPDQINKKSSISMITKAEIRNLFTLPDGRWLLAVEPLVTTFVQPAP